MKEVRPNPSGQFPMIPRDELVSLSLGNGSRFTVLVHVGQYGMFVAVENYGAYTFSTTAHAGYVASKLKLLEGDAERMAQFINDQNR